MRVGGRVNPLGRRPQRHTEGGGPAWVNHTSINNAIRRLVNPVYNINTYIFKVDVFTKQATYEGGGPSGTRRPYRLYLFTKVIE